jgi:hypothetical protein
LTLDRTKTSSSTPEKLSHENQKSLGKNSAEMLSDRSPFVMCCGSGMLSES